MKKLLIVLFLFGCKPYKTISIISTDSVGNMIVIKVKHLKNKI